MMRLGALRLLLAALICCAGSGAFAQATILNSGPWTPGHAPAYVSTGNSQPVMADSGNAANSGPGLTELLLQEQGQGLPPFVAPGSGPYGTNFCDYDGPSTSAAGYHYLCFSPNSQGGGLIAYGAGGGAASLPLQFYVNGALTSFSAFLSIAPGSAIISPSTNGGILYDNNGILGDSKTLPSGLTLPSPTLTAATLTTPNLGVPSAVDLLHATDLPLTALNSGALAAGVTVNNANWSGTPLSNGNLANSTISGVSLGGTLFTLTFGAHLTSGGASYNGSVGVTITSDATSANTFSAIVARDSSGNFTATTITAALTGHASLDCALAACTMGGTLTGADTATWGASGISAINLGATGTLSGKLVKATNAVTSASPTAPASTSVYTMQGLAGAITPSSSGNIQITISGTMIDAVATVNTGILIQISYGTSTAPTNGAAVTGTQVGLPQQSTLAVAATAAADVHIPFSITYTVTGLTPGTAYWIDLAAKAVTGASDMGLSNVMVVAIEQ